MNLGYLIENCKWYNYRTRRKDCGCLSCQQSLKDIDITIICEKNHIPGKWCERKNNCGKCCGTKWRMRLIQHIAYDRQRCTKKCEACHSYYFMNTGNRVLNRNLVLHAYRSMLKGNIY